MNTSRGDINNFWKEASQKMKLLSRRIFPSQPFKFVAVALFLVAMTLIASADVHFNTDGTVSGLTTINVSGELLWKTADCVVDASGNGDQTTLHGCINNTGYDHVHVKGGSYTLTTPLYPSSNMEIALEEDAVVNTSTSMTTLFYIKEVDGVKISGGQLDPGGTASYAVLLANASHCTVEGSRLFAPSSSGSSIRAYDDGESNYNLFRDLTIVLANNTNGINLDGDYNTVKDCYISNPGVTTGYNVYVRKGDHNLVENVVSIGGEHGIAIAEYQSEYNTVRGCDVSSVPKNCITLGSGVDNKIIKGNVVVDNIVHDCDDYGISVGSGNWTYLDGNVMYNNTRPARILATSEYTNFGFGNVIFNNTLDTIDNSGSKSSGFFNQALYFGYSIVANDFFDTSGSYGTYSNINTIYAKLSETTQNITANILNGSSIYATSFDCDGCINDDDVEGDVNTYVDIGGDTMTGTLSSSGSWIRFIYSSAGVKGILFNGTSQTAFPTIYSDSNYLVMQSDTGSPLHLNYEDRGATTVRMYNDDHVFYPDGNYTTLGTVQAADYRSGDGTLGYTGSCADGTSITVKDGLITGCS